MAKKKQKKTEVQILILRVPVIEVLLNFVPNPRKISPFGKKTLL